MNVHHLRRRLLAVALSMALAATGLAYLATTATAQQTIDYPVFSGPANPVPAEPAPYVVDGMMEAMYEAEKDGTDFWMDRLLARAGSDPAGNNWLLTRGRGLYMYRHTSSVIGFGGQTAYWDNIDSRNMYTVNLGDGGYSQVTSSRLQTPSHWKQTHTNPDAGFSVDVTKFITDNNVAVTNLAITNTGSATQTLPIEVTSPYATTADGEELTGVVDARNAVTRLLPRLSGDGLSVDGSRLVGSVSVDPGQTVETKVTMGFVTEEIAESLPEYEQYRSLSPADAFATHVQTYNKWWADNIPYIDVPEDAIKKQIYYRWWIMRYNFLDIDAPGNDWQFPVGIEGVTGYNNSIALTVPMFIDELKYLRDPMYAYGTMLSAGEGSRNERLSDNPGKPTNWNDAYLQYTTDASWRAYQVHGGQPEIVDNLAHYGEKDVKAQLDFYNPPAGVSGGNPYLLWYCCNYLNGNDADNASFSFYNRGNERAESAYVYANAIATAEAYELLGATGALPHREAAEKATEMRDIAGNVQDAILDVLWDDESNLFLNRDVHTDTLIPWKEINNYYPFTVGLVPNEEPYLYSLRLFDDPAEYPIFPFYTANQRDKAAAAAIGRAGSNNFSQINSTVQFRLLSSVLRNYDTDYLDNEWYKKLLYWNTWATYINGNTDWPDSNEYWFNWNPGAQTIGRSGIHHSMLGSSNWTVIEDVIGLRPRSDDKIELWPIDIEWDHFTVADINYRGRDLTIVWDQPGDDVTHYPGVPEGYSAYLDGELAFTVDSLVHAIWDPSTGQVELPDGEGTVLSSGAISGVMAPHEVALGGERVVDMFQKAGVDLTPLSDPRLTHRNLAPLGTQSASYTDPAQATTAYSATDVAAAVDGRTINLPFWGSAGSGNDADWYEIDFGRPTTFTEVKLYFFNDREIMGVPNQHRVTTNTNRYREPALYQIQVFSNGQWVNVPDQVRTPTYPRSNYNNAHFRPVAAQRMRVLMTHQQGYGTGLKEIEVFRSGGPGTREVNQPPHLIVRQDPSFQGAGQVRLQGIIRDDGLPDGTLDTEWTVVAGPGLALMDDPSSHRPVVSFSEGGEYVFELTASDGALTSTASLTVNVPDIPDQVNVSLQATPSCSYTSPWESCAAINDGIEPPQSNDGGNPRWGTWPQTGTQWIQLDWDDPVRVDEADMYFFADAVAGGNGGVQTPSEWSIQYWDGEAFVDVSNPSSYGVATNQYNNVTFDPVITTRLRATMTARPTAGGVGVLEWKNYSVAPESVAPVHVPTMVGELPDMPEKVSLIYADGRRLEANVAWEGATEAQVATPGTSFTLRGLVPGTTLVAEATVYVRAPGDVSITALEAAEVTTLVGVAPDLPTTVIATFSDGSRDNVTTVVTWEAVDPSLYQAPGAFTVAGTVAGTALPATANVTVVAP